MVRYAMPFLVDIKTGALILISIVKHCPGVRKFTRQAFVSAASMKIIVYINTEGGESMRCEYLSDDGATCLLGNITHYPICPGPDQYPECEDVREAARQEWVNREIKRIKDVWKNRR